MNSKQSDLEEQYDTMAIVFMASLRRKDAQTLVEADKEMRYLDEELKEFET